MNYLKKLINKSKNKKQRIVGGNPVNIANFPYYVRFNLGGYLCGGSILNEEWILTAAHCVIGENPANCFAYIMPQNRNDTTEEFNFVEIIVHENYNNYTLDNDIALVRVDITSRNLFSNTDAKSVGLPNSDSEVANETNSVVCGFGTTSSGGSLPSSLQAVGVQIVNCSPPDNSYSPNEITDNMICAGSNGLDSCQGDSGGPIVINCTSNIDCSNGIEQIGIVSWGYGCGAQGYPGVYTKVSKYINWINDKIGTQTECQEGYVSLSEDLKNALITNYGLSNSDFSELCIASANDIFSREELDVSGLNITNMKGIEYFTQLKDLNCSNNTINFLDLSSLVNLEKLDCSNNLISNLVLSENDQYKELYLYNNNINTIEFLQNYVSLLILDIDGTNFRSINVSNNVNLEELWCGANNFIFGYNLDISNLTNLKVFACYELGNRINFPNFTNNLNLEKIICYNSFLSSLDVSLLNELQILWCFGNGLSCISVNQSQLDEYKVSDEWVRSEFPKNWSNSRTTRYRWETVNKGDNNNSNLAINDICGNCGGDIVDINNCLCFNNEIDLGCGCGNPKPDIFNSCNNLALYILIGVAIIIILVISLNSQKGRTSKKRSDIIKDLNEINLSINNISKKLKI